MCVRAKGPRVWSESLCEEIFFLLASMEKRAQGRGKTSETTITKTAAHAIGALELNSPFQLAQVDQSASLLSGPHFSHILHADSQRRDLESDKSL